MDSATSAAVFEAGSDELGVFAQMGLDPKVFSETAILRTAYWFTDQYYVYFARSSTTGLLNVELRPKQGQDAEPLKGACGEFWNRLLDSEVRQRVLAETSGIRDTLV